MTDEPIRTITGYVQIPQQLYEQTLADQEAFRRLEHRLRTDAVFAAEWARRQDEMDDERHAD